MAGGKILYNKKYNLEYYNITKCGMTSICSTLKMTGHEFSTVDVNRRIFTVIRNPLDRFLSCFLYCRKIYGNKLTIAGADRVLSKSFNHSNVAKSFDLFLKEIEDNGFFEGHNKPQMAFLDGLKTPTFTTPRDFNKITDFILFEEMGEKLTELVGEKVSMKKLNPSSGKDKTLLKNKVEENRDRIITLYKEDWDLYQKLLKTK